MLTKITGTHAYLASTQERCAAIWQTTSTLKRNRTRRSSSRSRCRNSKIQKRRVAGKGSNSKRGRLVRSTNRVNLSVNSWRSVSWVTSNAICGRQFHRKWESLLSRDVYWEILTIFLWVILGLWFGWLGSGLIQMYRWCIIIPNLGGADPEEAKEPS